MSYCQKYIMQAQYANCLQKTYYFWVELQYSVVFQQKKKAFMDQAFVWKDKYLEEQNAEENWLRRKTGLVR